MSVITTVLGDMPASAVGHCQPHEHVYIVGTPALLTDPTLRINILSASINELKLYKQAGGDSLVDAQPLATGRDAIALQDASRESGVQIVASTGYHIPSFYGKGHWIFEADKDKLFELFLSELQEGMFVGGCYCLPQYRTNVRAGIVKAMILGEGAVGRVGTLLSAAGRAAKSAGAALMLHTDAGKNVMGALDLLEGVGLPPDRVLVCHVDRQVSDYSVHQKIAERGVYLEYDTTTLFEYHDSAAEIRLLQFMLDKGYGERILLSTDPTADRLKSYSGKVGMDYLLTVLIPMMRDAGMTQAIIDMIFRTNPARALRKAKV
jgi:5-phospho-D-xylono-1,4-lactonase